MSGLRCGRACCRSADRAGGMVVVRARVGRSRLLHGPGTTMPMPTPTRGWSRQSPSVSERSREGGGRGSHRRMHFACHAMLPRKLLFPRRETVGPTITWHQRGTARVKKKGTPFPAMMLRRRPSLVMWRHGQAMRSDTARFQGIACEGEGGRLGGMILSLSHLSHPCLNPNLRARRPRNTRRTLQTWYASRSRLFGRRMGNRRGVGGSDTSTRSAA